MLGINGKENSKIKRKRKVKRRKKRAMIEKIQFYNFHSKKIKIINLVEEGGGQSKGQLLQLI